MPADRTKSMSSSSGWGQTDMSCHQLVWTAPVAAPPTTATLSWNHYEYESSAQITELEDDGPPPLVDAPADGPPPPGEFILFPPPSDDDSSSAPTTKRSPHSKKKPENHIPRPPNAFILFRSSFIKGQHVSQEVETNHSTLSKIIGITWKNLPEAERKTWHDKAKKALEEHRRKFPKYAFRPQQTKTGKGGTGTKRKVREGEPKDMKRCAKIAELLGQGKKGQELEDEIAEFDKHHVPQIITRFEAPITERAFRRGSSAPVENTELSIEQASFLPKEKTTKKVRSVSQRPTRASTPLVAQTQVPQPQACSPLKDESSFDFSTFSFENVGSPVPPFTPCDPLAYTDAAAALSIDTNVNYAAMSADWSSQCSSPMTPESTTDFLSTPSPSPSFATPAEHFGNPFEKGFAAGHDAFQQQHLAFPQVVYQDAGIVDGLCGESFLGMGGEYGTYDMQQGMGAMDAYGLDAFAAYNAVPQYAF